MVDHILEDCGLKAASYKPVYGGDINECYCVQDQTGKYFLKINEADRYPGMFRKEMNGLKALAEQKTIKIPAVIRSGQSKEKQYLLLEWLEAGSPKGNSWKDFGKGLARMHKSPQSYFGFEEDNYIGDLQQVNNNCATWAEFYSNCRIKPLIKMLFDRKDISEQTIKAATAFYAELENIFPVETPSLLHGDLWSGNFMFDQEGQAVLFDPAVYYGHREMDLGMSRLFGGFHSEFYLNYNETYPLEKNWEKRIEYTQLYPLLVHAVLFDGHYILKCREILHRFL